MGRGSVALDGHAADTDGRCCRARNSRHCACRSRQDRRALGNASPLEGPGELRRREEEARRLPPLIDRLAARLLEQRGDRVGGLTTGRGDDDDLAGLQRAAVAPADLFRDATTGYQLREQRAEPAPLLEWDPRAVAGDERGALAIGGEHRDVLL